MPLSLVISLIVIMFTAFVACFRSVRVVPQQTAMIVERLGRYHRTLAPGITMVMPFVDRTRKRIDLREQVVAFPAQPITLSDSMVVQVDWVISYHVTDVRAATYEIGDFLTGLEQLAVTAMRNIGSGMDLDRMLASRDEIAIELRKVVGELVRNWGIQVNRIQVNAIDPPAADRP
jgi:regulator of protease activity HflC (stomatin/prohibitin superfamily)